jgi:molybdopterin synthase sulfur carrier subunit
MPRVELTKHLFQFFPQLAGKDLVVDGQTVAEVVSALDVLAPGIAFYVCDERGRLRQHVNVFIDEAPIIDRRELSDRLEPGSRVFIIQALSGGASPRQGG